VEMYIVAQLVMDFPYIVAALGSTRVPITVAE